MIKIQSNIHPSLNRIVSYSVGNTFAGGATGEPEPRQARASFFLEDWFSSHVETDAKTAIRYFAPGIFTGSKRQIVDSLGADFLVFDFDGADNVGDPNRNIARVLADLRAEEVAHFGATSYNHERKSAPGQSRWRLVLPADRRIEPDEHKAVWLDRAAWLLERGCVPDKSQDHLASVFYPPSCPVGSRRKWVRTHFEGAAFVVDAAVERGRSLSKDALFPKAGAQCPTTQTPGEKKARVSRPSKRGDRLPADTVFETKDGSTVAASTLVPGQKLSGIYCPWRTESNPSAVAWCSERGEVSVYDSGTSETRYVESRVDSWIGMSVTSFSLSSLKQEDVTERFKLEGDTITLPATPGEYIGDQLPDLAELLPNGGLVLLRAPLGSGKTQYARRQALAAKRVVAITDSVALTRAVAEDLQLEVYSEIKGDGPPERLATTVHSCARFEAVGLPPAGQLGIVGPRWDLAIMDEAPAVRASIHDATKKVAPPSRTKEYALAHLCSATHAIACSADLTEEEEDWLVAAYLRRNPGSEVIRVRRDPNANTRQIDLLTGSKWDEDLLTDIRDHVAGSAPLVVMTTEVAYPEVMAQMISESRPDLKVWWISSRNSKIAEVRSALSDPDSIIRNYDVIICSPTIKNGLSWAGKVRRVYLRATAELSAASLGQMIMRVRNPTDSHVRVMLSERRGQWDLNPQYLRSVALGLAEQTDKSVDRTMIMYDLDWRTNARTPHDPEMLSSWILSEAERRKNANDSLGEFLRMASRHAWPINDRRGEESTDEQRAEVAQQRKEAKAIVDGDYVDALLDSAPIDDSEAERLASEPTLTPEEQASLARHSLESYYGREASTELVELDNRGRMRRTVREFTRLRFWQSGIEAPARVADRHAKDPTEHKHVALRMAMLDRVLRMALGTTLDQAHGMMFDSAILAERIGPLLISHTERRAMREVLGVSVTEASATKPTQWICSLLRRLGVELTSSQQRCEDGTRTRTYTIDLTQIRDLSKAEHSRTLRLLAEMRGAKPSTPLDAEYMPDAEVMEALLASLGLAA